MIVQLLIDALMVFGGVIGYVDQIKIIKKQQSVGNFSVCICLILITCNILRMIFWIEEQFETALLVQSIIMVAVQIYLLRLCIQYYKSENINKIDSILTNPEYRKQYLQRPLQPSYWNQVLTWNKYEDNLVFFQIIWVIISLYTITSFRQQSYSSTIGFLSAVIEATLGLPQLLKNHKSKQTEGLSVALIGTWFVGDLGKTIYYIFKNQPAQFILCGITQLILDCLIIAQIKIYSKNKSE